MNFFQLKTKLEKEFWAAGIAETSDIDWIVCEITGKRRSELGRIQEFSGDELLKIEMAASKRLQHLPLGYIFGKTEFFGIPIKVTKDVLIPRLDTEILVEKVIKDINNSVDNLKILDIGTGSGAIAIAIAKNTNSAVTAVDISQPALDIARANAQNNGVCVEFVHSNLFENLIGRKFDIIVSNPPYIETEVIKTLDDEVRNNEPHLALDGGADGLAFYRKIVEKAPMFLKNGGKLYFEIGYNQAEAVEKLMQNSFKDIEILKDYENNDRVVLGEIL